MQPRTSWAYGIVAVVGLALLAYGLALATSKEASMSTRPPNIETGSEFRSIRDPAVAGLFYPAGAAELSRLVDGLLARATLPEMANVKAMICPHAGLPYSGPIAAQAFKTLQGRRYATVILLAASHYAMFAGASVARAEAYRTPLGLIPVSKKARDLATHQPYVLEPRCFVQRPNWWRQSSRTAPAPGEETPDTWEHALEVQLPFLQKVLKEFQIVPVVFGEADPLGAARVLAPLVDDQTLVVASSDLSHYHAYEEAKGLDQRCVQAIVDMDIERMTSQDACGKLPILTLMHLAAMKGWRPRLLDCRNSGDTAGDKTRVVGYAAIVFVAPETKTYSAADRKELLELARQSLQQAVTKTPAIAVNPGQFPSKLCQPKGCFVTLTQKGELRGCIGNLTPQQPLYQAIRENANHAALRDPRFPPVQPEELGQTEIEISILTEPQPLNFSSPDDLLRQLRPGVDGVVLRVENRSATYLPQVWAQIPDPAQFLSSLSRKAGGEPADWRKPGTIVFTYQVESFKESEP